MADLALALAPEGHVPGLLGRFGTSLLNWAALVADLPPLLILRHKGAREREHLEFPAFRRPHKLIVVDPADPDGAVLLQGDEYQDMPFARRFISFHLDDRIRDAVKGERKALEGFEEGANAFASFSTSVLAAVPYPIFNK